MRILCLQLRRIGDLVLTTPALRQLRLAFPKSYISLAMMDGSAGLAPMLGDVDRFIVLGSGRLWSPWQQLVTGHWDVCIDFTGNDRSAFASILSRARHRVTYASARRHWWRRGAYTHEVDAPVRDRHTIDHFQQLVLSLDPGQGAPERHPVLRITPEALRSVAAWLPEAAGKQRFAIVHPGTARTDKYWLPERWAGVIEHLEKTHRLPVLITGGADAFEQDHIAAILAARAALRGAATPAPRVLAGQTDLPQLAALCSAASLVVSCDTSVVHMASAFQTPQVVLYGPINPFHWAPRHARVAIFSGSGEEIKPDALAPRKPRGTMSEIPEQAVLAACDRLLLSGTDSGAA